MDIICLLCDRLLDIICVLFDRLSIDYIDNGFDVDYDYTNPIS